MLLVDIAYRWFVLVALFWSLKTFNSTTSSHHLKCTTSIIEKLLMKLLVKGKEPSVGEFRRKTYAWAYSAEHECGKAPIPCSKFKSLCFCPSLKFQPSTLTAVFSQNSSSSFTQNTMNRLLIQSDNRFIKFQSTTKLWCWFHWKAYLRICAWCLSNVIPVSSQILVENNFANPCSLLFSEQIQMGRQHPSWLHSIQ